MRPSRQQRAGFPSALASFEQLESRRLLTVNAAALEAAGYQAIDWNGQTTYAVPDQWIVQVDGLKGNASKQVADANGLLAGAGVAGALKASKHLGADGALVVKSTAGQKIGAVKAALAKVKGFKWVEPDFAVWTDVTTPNDPSYAGSLWGLNNTGQSGGKVDADIDAPEAWDSATGAGSNVVVGVIDSGVNYNHPDLAANAWKNVGEIAGDGIDNDANGYVDDVYGWDFANNDNNPMDDHGHGTHVAGTIAAVGNNGIGVTGVSWGAKVMALKFLSASGSGSTSAAISAINYATTMKQRGVNLVATNNSWGGGGFSSTLQAAIQNHAAAGVLFIAAAGNGGSDGVGDNNDSTAHYPSSYSVDNILAVAATDRNDALASFSNYGITSVDLAAPGVSIYSTSSSGSYTTMSGTSMATPHVAGVAALARAYAPTATYQQIRSAILNGVDVISSLSGKTVTGGRLNAQATLSLLGAPVSAPSAPTLNSISAASATQINLSWSNVANETGYRVYRAAGGSSFSLITTLGADVTSFSNTGLSASTTYSYYIVAFNTGGDSPDSNVLSATTPAAAVVPAAPSNLGATALSKSQIRLNWTDNSGNETGFKVERSTNGSSWSQIATVGANAMTYTATGLKRKTTYYFRVRAYNGVGNSGYSNTASVKTLASSTTASQSLFSSTLIRDASVPLEALLS